MKLQAKCIRSYEKGFAEESVVHFAFNVKLKKRKAIKILINKMLFPMLDRMDGTFDSCNQNISPLYDEFVDTVTSLSISPKGDVPAYFTLHYTRLELERLQIRLSDEESKKISLS